METKLKSVKRSRSSALVAIYEAAKKKANSATRAEFKTYSQAIEAILALRSENETLRGIVAHLKSKKPRGRPPKEPKYSFSMLLNGGKEIKRKGGRPTKYKNPEEKLREWDNWRQEVAKKENKKSVTDLYLIGLALKNNEKNGGAAMTRDQKTAFIKMMRSAIKQMRDKTGMRIHKRRKAENPSPK